MKLRPIESAPHHSSNAAALSPLCERTVHSIETISTLQYTAILQGIGDEPNLVGGIAIWQATICSLVVSRKTKFHNADADTSELTFLSRFPIFLWLYPSNCLVELLDDEAPFRRNETVPIRCMRDMR
jgi:hypothetical protein